METLGQVILGGVIFTIVRSYYTESPNKATAISLRHEDGTLHGVLSVYLYDPYPLSELLKPGRFYANHWSGMEEIINELIAKQILIRTDDPPAIAGFVYDVYAYEINPEWIDHTAAQRTSLRKAHD